VLVFKVSSHPVKTARVRRDRRLEGLHGFWWLLTFRWPLLLFFLLLTFRLLNLGLMLLRLLWLLYLLLTLLNILGRLR
jgi:hypothetical protein